MIQAVLDTPTLVAGLGWHRAPARRVVNAALAGRFVPITSPELLAELELALGRPELEAVFADPARIAELIGEMSVVISAPGSCRVVADPNANRLLALAESGGAEFLVTADIALLQLGRHGETTIVRPR